MARARKPAPPTASTDPRVVTEGSALPVLAALEERVRQAAGELARLRRENGELTRRAAELEARLHDAATASGGAASGAAFSFAAADAAWSAEREEIRERVDRLVRTLAELLDAAGPEQVGVQASLEA